MSKHPTAPQAIIDMCTEILAESPNFLVRTEMQPANKLKVYVDGDEGVNIATIAQISRELYKRIEEQELYPEGDFSLELSSPGVDEPLLLQRQYIKNIGRDLTVTLEDGTSINGELTAVAPNENIELLETINQKKNETKPHTISFDQIKEAVVVISFKKK